MGLPAIWLRVARAIGYDAFMEVWRLLDESAEARELRLSDNESMIEVSLRRLSSFRRYQRNRFVETLAASGLKPAQIHHAIKAQLGEDLSRDYVRRLVAKTRLNARGATAQRLRQPGEKRPEIHPDRGQDHGTMPG